MAKSNQNTAGTTRALTDLSPSKAVAAAAEQAEKNRSGKK